jgi:hypothetical protein
LKRTSLTMKSATWFQTARKTPLCNPCQMRLKATTCFYPASNSWTFFSRRSSSNSWFSHRRWPQQVCSRLCKRIRVRSRR